MKLSHLWAPQIEVEEILSLPTDLLFLFPPLDPHKGKQALVFYLFIQSY